MAQDKIIVRLELQGLDQADKQIGELDQQMNRLRATQKQLKKDTANGTTATLEQKKEMGNLTVRIKNLQQEKTKLTAATKKLNQGQRANTNTIEGLRQRNRALVAEMQRVNINTEKGKQRLAQLRTEFLANDKQVRQFDQSLGRHQANVGNYQGALNNVKNNIAAVAAGITAAVMVFQRINSVMSESIELFKTQELAERQLQFAVGEASDALIKQTAALQQQTTFGDEAIIQMQGLLGSFGSTADEIERLTPLILDYAAASGQDLSQAATKVNNILNGTSTTLRGTQIRLSETADANERYNAVLNEFAKFQGAASALADTQAGRVDQLTNAYNDQREELGAKLIPIQLAFLKGQLSIIKAFSEVGKFISENKRLLVALAVTTTLYTGILARQKIAELAMIAIKKVQTAWTNRATIAQAALNFVMSMNPIGLVIAALGGLVTWLATSEKGMNVFRVAFEKVSEGIEWLKLNIVNLLKIAFYPYVKGLELVTVGLNKLGLISDDTAGKITNLTAINFKQVESTKAAGAGWDNLKASIERVNEVEQRLADDRARRDRKQGGLDARAEEMHQRELDAIDEKVKARKKAAEEAAKELAKEKEARAKLSEEQVSLNNVIDSTTELLDEMALQGQLFGETIDNEFVPPATRLEERIAKAQLALGSLKGISLDSAMQQLSQLTQEGQGFERAMVLVGASVTAIDQALTTRFENQKQRIEQQTLAEKEAIESSTLSEEDKRIRIERAEQKKATEIEKIEQKQAKQKKANAIIESLINTALGISNALGTLGPFAFAVIPAIATIGAVQTGIIAAQQFAEGGQVADLGSGQGGVVPTTAQNIPALANGDNVLATVRTGEVILNDKQQQRLAAIASPNIFRAIGVPGFADGGVVPNFSNTQRATASRIETSSQRVADTGQRIKVVNVATDTTAMALQVQNNANEATLG